MPAARPHRIIARNPSAPQGVCRLVENGAPCNRRAASRGICGAHAKWLRKKHRLEEFAEKEIPRTFDYARNDQVVPGFCAVLQNGAACARLAGAGEFALCSHHWATLWHRPDVPLAQF